jgi:hypothetical protein
MHCRLGDTMRGKLEPTPGLESLQLGVRNVPFRLLAVAARPEVEVIDRVSVADAPAVSWLGVGRAGVERQGRGPPLVDWADRRAAVKGSPATYQPTPPITDGGFGGRAKGQTIASERGARRGNAAEASRHCAERAAQLEHAGGSAMSQRSNGSSRRVTGIEAGRGQGVKRAIGRWSSAAARERPDKRGLPVRGPGLVS